MSVVYEQLWEPLDQPDAKPQVITWADDAALAEDWWAHYVVRASRPEQRPLRWTTPAEDAAEELVERLCDDGDPRALRLLVQIAEIAPDRLSLFYLGAGPLEELVVHHVDEIAQALVDAATRSRRFRIALSGVWIGGAYPMSAASLALLEPFLGDDETTPFD